MMKILVTGSRGFLGRHVVEAVRRLGAEVIEHTKENSTSDLERGLAKAEFVFHLAGVNRPTDAADFERVNAGLTEALCRQLSHTGRKPVIVFASSVQTSLDNPYGLSKRNAENALADWSDKNNASAVIFRLKNIFGKWSRPNYNSVIATFCHNIARNLPIQIADENRVVELVYIDDVVDTFLQVLKEPPQKVGCEFRKVKKSFSVTLGALAAKIRSFHVSRKTLLLQDLSDEFTRNLLATYLSFLPEDGFEYALEQRVDNRGTLSEFIKSSSFGQIFISRTKPGITRGNHFHHTKVEKFLVVEGHAIVRFRGLSDERVIEYPVTGKEFKVIDIPPGYTHSIENVGSGEMVVLFWASEIFDPQRPDTFALPVLPAARG